MAHLRGVSGATSANVAVLHAFQLRQMQLRSWLQSRAYKPSIANLPGVCDEFAVNGGLSSSLT